jgi:hypothetical protein
MDNLNQIEKRIAEKQKIFNQISLKRQKRVEIITKKNITKDSYVQTENFSKRVIKLEIEDNDEKIIEDLKIYSDKAIQCSMEIKKVEINNTIYLRKFFEQIANIEILDFFSFEEHRRLMKLKCLYQVNPYYFNFHSNFNKNLELVFFNDYNVVLKVFIVKKNSIGKFLMLLNQDKVVIGKFSINLPINQPINIKVENFRFFFNDQFLFHFNTIKYFYSSSNNFLNKNLI